MSNPSFNVVNPRLAVGRGEEFSASRQNERLQVSHELEDSPRLPINQRTEDSLDTDGLQMASTKEAIPESNLGFQMLQRMGWKGQGLGTKEDGIVEPVGGGAEAGVRLGLGKQEQDNFYTAPDNIQRKRLETELQANEDDERAAKREVEAEREQRIKEEVSTIKRTFFCEVCHKQYATAAEMEVHLSSYDHHHKKRLVEMRSAENERTRRGRDKREKRRQEKELSRLNSQIQKARGTSPPSSTAPPFPEEPPPPPPPDNLESQARDIPKPFARDKEPALLFGLPQTAARDSVQFNMGLSISKKEVHGKASKSQQWGVKKTAQPLKKVAGFSADSDDD